jgi:hypothetical protein
MCITNIFSFASSSFGSWKITSRHICCWCRCKHFLASRGLTKLQHLILNPGISICHDAIKALTVNSFPAGYVAWGCRSRYLILDKVSGSLYSCCADNLQRSNSRNWHDKTLTTRLFVTDPRLMMGYYLYNFPWCLLGWWIMLLQLFLNHVHYSILHTQLLRVSL